MRKNKVPENIIEEANTYYETNVQDILMARSQFKLLEAKYEEQIRKLKEKIR